MTLRARRRTRHSRKSANASRPLPSRTRGRPVHHVVTAWVPETPPTCDNHSSASRLCVVHTKVGAPRKLRGASRAWAHTGRHVALCAYTRRNRALRIATYGGRESSHTANIPRDTYVCLHRDSVVFGHVCVTLHIFSLLLLCFTSVVSYLRRTHIRSLRFIDRITTDGTDKIFGSR